MATNKTTQPEKEIPSSILIIGAGVFGLSTAYSLCKNPLFKDTSITLVEQSTFPNPLGSSIDDSRIIRADYSDPAYAALGLEAQEIWRGEFGNDGRYSETGLCLTVDAQDTVYTRNSLLNVQTLLGKLGIKSVSDGRQAVEILGSVEEIKCAVGHEGCSGVQGYVNRTSGWADAEVSMRYCYNRLASLNRVKFVTATVTRLAIDHSVNPPTIRGVHTSGSSKPLTADLTIIAAGAWSPALVDLRGIARCTGQTITYIPVSPEQEAALKTRPTLLNMSSGLFAIPAHNGHLKIGRHGHGYSNPTTIPHPELPSEKKETITVSLPAVPPPPVIPNEGIEAHATFLKDMYPTIFETVQSKKNPFTKTRICYYLDTPTGDFLITYHPDYASKSLFLATGGNGHAFKFLPTIGDRIVDRILGKGDPELARRWTWPERLDEEKWLGDGSRGGPKGMVLSEELAKGVMEAKSRL